MKNIDTPLTREFITVLVNALEMALSETENVIAKVAATVDHAPSNPETRFCKACVLPIVDRVATAFMRERCSAAMEDVKRALRCEGIETLRQVYSPGVGQAGFGSTSWYPNEYPFSKTGKPRVPGPGKGDCADFGISFRPATGASLTMLGEVKYSSSARGFRSTEIDRLHGEIRHYLRLPKDLRRWDYDYGFGLAYAAGGSGKRRVRLIEEYWASDRFIVAVFEAP